MGCHPDLVQFSYLGNSIEAIYYGAVTSQEKHFLNFKKILKGFNQMQYSLNYVSPFSTHKSYSM